MRCGGVKGILDKLRHNLGQWCKDMSRAQSCTDWFRKRLQVSRGCHPTLHRWQCCGDQDHCPARTWTYAACARHTSSILPIRWLVTPYACWITHWLRPRSSANSFFVVHANSETSVVMNTPRTPSQTDVQGLVVSSVPFIFVPSFIHSIGSTWTPASGQKIIPYRHAVISSLLSGWLTASLASKPWLKILISKQINHPGHYHPMDPQRMRKIFYHRSTNHLKSFVSKQSLPCRKEVSMNMCVPSLCSIKRSLIILEKASTRAKYFCKCWADIRECAQWH